MSTIVINIDKQEERLLKDIDCGEIPLTELPTLQGVVGKICCELNSEPTRNWFTLKQILNAFEKSYEYDTFFKVSRPTTSAVRKVALLGRPEIGPVSLSTSSMVSPYSLARLIAIIIP